MSGLRSTSGLVRTISRTLRTLRTLGLALSAAAAVALAASPERATAPADHGIASAHPLATEIGERILAEGGNAFDAAVAVSAALAVVEPFSSGLGGGGFWLLHRASDGSDVVVDGRERAPLEMQVERYFSADGKFLPQSTIDGPTAAAIPGSPAALDHIARHYASLPLSHLLEPARRLARDGFAVDSRYASLARIRLEGLRASRAARAIFLQDGDVPKPGFKVVQSDLATTIERLGRLGAAGFYRGETAAELVWAARTAGGNWSAEDLLSYRVIERVPVRFALAGGCRVTTADLPSGGGPMLAESLGILDALDYASAPVEQRPHLVVEALRRAFHDRQRYLGDPDFMSSPSVRLDGADYVRARAASVDREHATVDPAQLDAVRPEGDNTTHFSVIDRWGNRVAATMSINTPFGSAFIAGRTGILLNNEMDDFSFADSPNAYGLGRSARNRAEPGKRPLSSMSPTFVEDERGVLALGTPGGSRIVSMLLLGILDYCHGPDPDPARIVAAPRYHHQFSPDRVELEPDAFPPELLESLQRRGHKVETGRRKWGNMQAVFFNRATGRVSAASDPRGAAGPAWY